MQNIFVKQIKKLKNELLYQQNFITGEILGIKVLIKDLIIICLFIIIGANFGIK